ncbi:hypothetical protein ACLUEY_08115 [Vreelandella aquamarina]
MGNQQKRGKHLQKNPLQKLKGSVQHYDQPFDPVGAEDWETVLLDGLMPDTAHADSLAKPTLKELGEESDSNH